MVTLKDIRQEILDLLEMHGVVLEIRSNRENDWIVVTYSNDEVSGSVQLYRE